MNHPEWYYKLYKEIFEYNRNYIYEIKLINKYCSIRNKDILEIGSGTGNHAEQILRYVPNSLKLVDNDANAISILKDKFKDKKSLEIAYCDGFNLSNYPNIVICMFSLLQQQGDIYHTISYLLNNINSNGYFSFEFIDTERSKNIYKNKVKSNIYNKNDINIFIHSEYNEKTTEIIYSGNFMKQDVSYSVRIYNLSKKSLLNEFGNRISVISLDKDSRRNIAIISKTCA
jgi:hypothetical protein